MTGSAILTQRPMRPGDRVPVEVDRWGYSIDGERYSRVTGVTGMLPKPWLGAWAAKTVAEAAYDLRDEWVGKMNKRDAVKFLKDKPWAKRDEAADHGTLVHNAIEAYLTDRPLPDGLTERGLEYTMAAERWLRAFRPVVHYVELTVLHPRYRYAGTLDVSCTIALPAPYGESRWVVDWKTGKGVYREYAIQIAGAYRRAPLAVTADGEVIEWGPAQAGYAGVVHLSPTYDQGYAFVPLVPGELMGDAMARSWTVFRAARHIKEWADNEGGDIGSPIPPPQREG